MFGVRISKLGSASKLGLIAKAIGILRKYGTDAHVYLPGIGTVSGLTAGNYLDSAGTTAATVDNPVGLSLDALQAMTLGSELVTNGDNEAALFNLGTMGAQKITPSRVAAVGGRSGFVMRGLSSSAASVNHQYNCGNATLSANTTYLISVDVYVPTGGISSCKFFDNDDGSFFSPDVTTKDAWVTITAIRQPKATPWTLGFGNNSLDVVASGSPAFYLDNVSIKQIPGIHATQATTANKPILRRGLLNLLRQSQALATTPWAARVGTIVATNNFAVGLDGTTTATKLDKTGVVEAAWQQNIDTVMSASTPYTAVFILQKSVTTKIAEVAIRTVLGGIDYSSYVSFDTLSGATYVRGDTGTPAVTVSVADASTYWVIALNKTSASGASSDSDIIIRPYIGTTLGVFDATATGSCVVWRAGLFQGTYTAQQIIDAGGIPLTTSAAASSTTGKYWWQFDGVNDSLSLSAPLFQMSDDHCVICAFSSTSTAATVSIFALSGATPTPLAPLIQVSPTANQVQTSWRDDSGTLITLTNAYTLGEVCVVSARKSGSQRQARKNGVVGGTSTTAMGPTTLTEATIGSWSVPSFHQGSIYPVIAIKGTVSDSDLLTLERFVGQLSGVTGI